MESETECIGVKSAIKLLSKGSVNGGLQAMDYDDPYGKTREMNRVRRKKVFLRA